MERRALLALLATGVSGCTVPGSAGDDGRSIPDGAEEPPAVPGADEVVYPGFDGGPLELTADPHEAALPNPTIEFRVRNARPNLFETNFYAWRMHTLLDGEWWFLGPFEPLDPGHGLWPAESHTWEASVDNDALETPAGELVSSLESSFTMAGLGGGIYAFSIVGGFYGDGTTLGVVTPFELDGADVPLVPASNVETTRAGDTVRVTETDATGEDHRITATRRGPSATATELAPEWGLREPGIRNTVPFLSEEIRRVEFSRSRPVVHDVNRVDGQTFAHEEFAVEFELIGG